MLLNKNSPCSCKQQSKSADSCKQIKFIKSGSTKMENNYNITQEILKVIPKTNYLSPKNLIHWRNVEISSTSSGLKQTKQENSVEEQIELKNLYDQLQKQLSKPRIERLAGRALGDWDPVVSGVRVVRKDGKFGNFGYSVDGEVYLEYYEAMFLLEVNRLQLQYNSTVLSIEQAYLLLMGEEQSPKFQEYFVYSNLTRVGYILVNHQNIHFQKQNIKSQTDCVWAILDAELQDSIVPDYVRKSVYYAKAKQNFDNVKNAIKNQNYKNQTDSTSNSEIAIDFRTKLKPNLKRSANDKEKLNLNNWHTAKRRCNYVTSVLQHSLVDFLKEEDEYSKFKDIFEKFEIIPLKINESDDDNINENAVIATNPLQINFDVYLHNEGFRKSSPHLPNFRVIILKPDERFPTHDEIFLTHRQQLNPVPLLIVSVNDSKQLQAFLYYFS